MSAVTLPPDDDAVVLRNVRKQFGSGSNAYEALRGVDFRVRRGELVMLSGPSGSGKTTLLSILGCILTATSGEVSLFGRNVANAPERDLPALRLGYVGFVFQSHNLLAALSAEENVALLFTLRGYSFAESRRAAAALLERVGLSSKRRSRPSELSGGQRQRVAIARALAGDPPLLLADEPTASLDAANGLAVTEQLRTLAKQEGRTVVVVTHDPRIFHLADRVVHIEDGRMVEDLA